VAIFSGLLLFRSLFSFLFYTTLNSRLFLCQSSVFRVSQQFVIQSDLSPFSK